MGDLTREQRDRGLQFIGEIFDLIPDAPDLKAEAVIHRLASQFLSYYGHSWSYKKAQVLSIIRKQPLTIPELREELPQLLRPHLAEILSELIDEGRVRSITLKAIGEKGGRPTNLIEATNLPRSEAADAD